MDTQTLHSETFDEISDVINRDVDVVLDLWATQAFHEQPSASSAYRAEMLDQMPSFLRALAASLRRSDSEQHGLHRLKALEHGEQRWSAGWRLAEVVRDYQILRIVLINHLTDVLQRPVSMRESLAIGLLLDEAIAAAVVMFAQTNDHKLEMLNRSLTTVTAEAEASNQAKSAFLANVSHEIRNPMSAILGHVELLQMDLKEPKYLQSLQTIKRNADFLLQILNDVLDLSKIEARKFEVEQVPVNPTEVADDVSTLMTLHAAANNIPLLIEYPGKIPQTIVSDPKRLRQILINLVSNAIKFTDRGAVTLKVFLLRTGPQPQIAFAVSDTGIGIPVEEQDRVFEPFLQAEGTLGGQFGGTGLGLTISKHLAEMLGGRIDLESCPGAGSTFRLVLPTGSLEGVPMITPSAVAPGSLPATPSPSPPARLACRVLAVEDRRDNRIIIAEFLRKSGAKVTLADNGRLAVELVAKAVADGAPFDIVLMDMQMPEVDGYQATAQLRADGYRVPIIALTASAMKGDHQKCLDAGCDSYLAKPIDFALLVKTIGRHLPPPVIP